MMHSQAHSNEKTATFGGGCFWCLEPLFDGLKGVDKVVSGYSGGAVKNPSYREVSSGNTGHAEVVKIWYNPEVVSYSELLTVFFSMHDPTTLNRQGADVGTQYRSVVFYHSDEQKQQALEMIDRLEKEKVFDRPIVTEVSEAPAFFEAEDYHQDYYRKNPNQGYCRVVINPKMDKFKKQFKEMLKTE